MSSPRNTADYLGAQFLRDQMIWHAVHSWLKTATFDQVTELWWMAQNEKATEEERHQKRLADPDDLYGKSAEYCNEYFAKRKAAAQ